MTENDDSNSGFFAELGRWMGLALKCNETLVEDTLDQIKRPHKQTETLLGGLTSFAQSVLSSDPECLLKLMQNQLDLVSDHLSLIESTLERVMGKKSPPVIHPSINDRRFLDDEWTANPFFDFIKQSYLLNNRALASMVDCMNLNDPDREKIDFYVRQVSSALAPTNFPLSNPEIVRSIQESQGESLFRGITQLIEDQKKSGDYLNVCMSDTDSFVLGDNIAHTPGKVVFENELMQLIQYSPSRAQVYRTPMLLIPSWINKYYVYDLRENNSMVKWALDKGLTVFMVSWINPDADHRNLGFDDYVQKGLLTAVEQVKRLAGVESVNCAGYCLGGALLAATVAYLAKKGDDSIKSASYFAASFDFTDPGDFRVMLDDYFIGGVSQSLEATGFFDGRELAVSFSMLRENELYWNYYIQNYLKGERPSAFDILYWNTDSTNVTANMHVFVMKELIKGNMFTRPEGFMVLGERVSLQQVKIPVYILAAEKDHIAKWESCYAGTKLHGGDCRFILGGSGHIAGVINPTSKSKYHYYTNARLSEDAEDWLDSAFKHEGSWWRDWFCWLSTRAGEKREALPVDPVGVIEDAPGRYVKRRLDKSDSSRQTSQAA